MRWQFKIKFTFDIDDELWSRGKAITLIQTKQEL